MRRLVLLVAITTGALLVATPAAAKPVTTVLYQDHYSTLTSTVHGNRQAVTLTSTFPIHMSPEGSTVYFLLAVDEKPVYLYPGDTVILPRKAELIDVGNNSYPSLWLYEEADACTSNTGICVHGEYWSASGYVGQCDVYVENPTDTTVTVTLFDADGVALGSFTAGPGQTLLRTFENAQCPASASVE